MRRYIPVFVVVAFIALCAIAQVIDYPGGGSGSGGGGGGSADALTNNDTRAIQFFDSLFVVDEFTNGGSARFEQDITVVADINQASGNTTTVGALNASDLSTFQSQVIYSATNFNGSNGVTATALTNNWDMTAKVFFNITNVIGTNLTFNISNALQSGSLITVLKGIGGYSNTVTFLAGTGVNIRWMNWATNGNYDVQTRPGFNYTVQMFANSATNIHAWVSSDDIYVPVSSVWHFAVNSGISNMAATNISVRAGASTSNAFVGGTLYFSTTDFTNCCAAPATLTNAQTVSIPAHTLTNTGDALRFWIAGQTANALATTNNIKIAYGSSTVLDTGLQIASNRQWTATGTITRTGLSSQRVEATFWWPGAGTASVMTNSVVTIGENNGIANTLAVQLGSQRIHVLTNNYFKVTYEPAPRG